VSNASDDLPDPERPVMTVSASRGMVTSTSFRLCSRAPETTMAFDRVMWVMTIADRTDVPTARNPDGAEIR
jgi:hypothetical protein